MARSDYLKSRYSEDYLVETRNGRLESYDSWHSRIDDNDTIIRGEFPVIGPDGSTLTTSPIVGNLMDQMPRDAARLASEIQPSYRCPTNGDSQQAIDNAELRAVISEGYFQKGRFEILRPQLVMDLVVCGAAFTVLWTDSTSDYPRMMRVDPRAAYPDVYNGVLQDLLVVQKVKVRVADRMWPDADIGPTWNAMGKKNRSDYVEIWDYYCQDEILKAVALTDSSGMVIENGLKVVASTPLEMDRPPAAFYMVPSPDGAIRGLVDQIGPGLVAKNQLAAYLLEAAEQWVHAPFFARGVVNADDPPGVNTIYQADPVAAEVEFRRVDPAASNPQIFGLWQQMDDEQRAQIAYPAARQGNVQQSIVSNAGVQGMQGQLSSLVREIQRGLADMQEQAGYVAQALDIEFKDFEKPLLRNVGNKKMYLPSRDIKLLGLEVNYGAGSGLDRMNADVRLFQAYGAGVISAATVLENLDYVGGATDELERRQREEVIRIILQRWAGDPNTSIDFMIRVQYYMDEGMSVTAALQAVMEEMSTQNAQAEQAALEAGTPAQAETQEELVKGEVPSGPPAVEPSFSPAPLNQIFTSPQR